MFRINRGQIESESKKATAKSDNLRSNVKVFDAVKLVFLNPADEITRFPVYNAAHWTCNVDRWIDNLQSENNMTYRRGEIVFLDLGAQNFKYEPSYTHACIVLADRKNSILIVPCSTKKYGSGYFLIFAYTFFAESATPFARIERSGITGECPRAVSLGHSYCFSMIIATTTT